MADHRGTTIAPGSDWDDPVESFDSRIREYPIEAEPTHYIERRVYRQNAAKYKPLDRGVPLRGADDAVYLVGQGILSRNGNLLTFFRDYATIPATWTEPTTTSYEFIGFRGTWEVDGRRREVKKVNAIITHDYYLPGITPGINTDDDVPVVSAQKYHIASDSTLAVNYLSASAWTTPTSPTKEEYTTMITNGDEIVTEDSDRSIYLGPIIERKTTRVKAQ